MKIVLHNKLFESFSLITVTNIDSFNVIVRKNLVSTFNKLSKINITIITIKESSSLFLILREVKTSAYLYMIMNNFEYNDLFINIKDSELSQILY